MTQHIDTKCIHSGWSPKNGEPRQVPIIQSTTFSYDSADTVANLFDLKESGYFYTRLANPTNDNVAKKICDLEGGVAALLTASGQAANFYAIFNLASAGDHILCSSAVYGGTFNLFAVTLKRMGIDVSFISPFATDDEIRSELRPNTKAIFGETIANPALVVLDIERFAKIAHEFGIPLVIDNTFATPVFCRPIEHGADIVTHSTSKYMDGHAAAIGGVVIDSGRFDWAKYPDRFPDFCQPEPSYHGIVYTDTFGSAAYLVKMLTQLMRDLGAITAPMNAYITHLGLETLHLRMHRHSENALSLAKYLEQHELVTWVQYPKLTAHPQYELTQKLMPEGCCGVIAFGVKGGREQAKIVLDAFKLIDIETHVAESKTIAIHPASTTHRQLTAEQLEQAGVKPDMIRLSVGIEHVDDLIADLDQALSQIKL